MNLIVRDQLIDDFVDQQVEVDVLGVPLSTFYII